LVATTEHNEAVIYADVDLSKVEEVRTAIPIRNQRQDSVYPVVRP
jgi:predicted amidohydrolase